jgi:hypothetical protein
VGAHPPAHGAGYLRVQQAAPEAQIMLRSWDIDDHNGDRKREVYADPKAAAFKHMEMWRQLLGNILDELRRNSWYFDKNNWYLGLINEPDPSICRR